VVETVRDVRDERHRRICFLWSDRSNDGTLESGEARRHAYITEELHFRKLLSLHRNSVECLAPVCHQFHAADASDYVCYVEEEMVLESVVVDSVGTGYAPSLREKPVMNYSPDIHRRKSVRLRGFDYAQAGSYFVTIGTKNGVCMLGDVKNAAVVLSPLGKIVEACWREVPLHYPEALLESLQVMPNHIHAIITIDHRVRDGACPVPTKRHSLSNIIGSFKSAVTKAAHQCGHAVGDTIWQERFHDRIVRDDTMFYFTQQYIELNPLMWEYSRHNPYARAITLHQFERILDEKFKINGHAAAIILGSEKLLDLNLK
jgi:putative transposase